MEQIVIYLLMVQKLLNLKQKILKLQHITCVQEIFQDFSVDNMKKIGLCGYVYDAMTGLNGYVYGIVYDAIPVDDILDIDKYLMKKHDIK